MLAVYEISNDNFYDMSVPKANYHEIAETFDQGRRLDVHNLDTWLELVRQHGRIEPGMLLLDLGCGTGRFAIPFALQLGAEVTGADAYEEMLIKARSKPGAKQVTWDVQDADHLSYPDNSFDAVFMSHVLHHVNSAEGVVASSHRILRPLGALLVRHGAIEDIVGDVEHRFFKGATEIDTARTLSTADMEELFQTQGFNDVHSVRVKQPTYTNPAERLDRARLKFTSVLHLIPGDAFKAGIEAMSGYVMEHPDDPWLLEDTLTLTIGYKPA